MTGQSDSEGHQIYVKVVYGIAKPWVPVDFVIIDNPKIAFLRIEPKKFSSVGKKTYFLVIYDDERNFSWKPLNIEVINFAPFFIDDRVPRNLVLRFNTSLTEMLPPHTEPERSPVCIIPTVKYIGNGKNYSDVITFPFELIGDRFQMTLKTSDWTRLGKYNVTLALSDTANFTLYWFTLEIFNTAPRFMQNGPVSQILRLGTVDRYKMPRM